MNVYTGFVKRGQPLQRHTPFRSASSLRRSPVNPVSRRRTRDDIPATVRKAVRARSGGICECGCGRPAQHVHHRKLRSQGGRHELPNLLHLSHACHAAAHGNPERSYALGLIVHGWADPADVPVVRVERAA